MLRSRIAPTPSGYLHTGNLCAFVRTWWLSRRQQGQLLLRIDDLDNDRMRPAYLQQVFDWLNLLGLDYDAGPRHAADVAAQWSQHHRLPLYHHWLQQLAATGQVYACTCSRSQYAGLYPGTCRHRGLPLDTPNATWRLHTPQNLTISWTDEAMGAVTISPFAHLGDVVIRRRNGLPAYQVASLADDVHFDINYVVRGEDLLASTAIQLHMARLLEARPFLQTRFYHHALITDSQGRKLSKTAGDGLLAGQPHQLPNAASAWAMLQQQCGFLPTGPAITHARQLLQLTA